jgi:hypothetical protein
MANGRHLFQGLGTLEAPEELNFFTPSAPAGRARDGQGTIV